MDAISEFSTFSYSDTNIITNFNIFFKIAFLLICIFEDIYHLKN